MATVEGSRQYDLALFGATGFTGGLTAHYLAANGPGDMRWALVGRNAAKLEAVRGALGGTRRSPAPAPELLERRRRRRRRRSRASPRRRGWSSPRSARTRSTASPLVAACAAAGTDYVDLTGEPEFVDRTWIEHHADGASGLGHAWCTAAGSTRSRTTWVPTSRSSSCPRACR